MAIASQEHGNGIEWDWAELTSMSFTVRSIPANSEVGHSRLIRPKPWAYSFGL